MNGEQKIIGMLEVMQGEMSEIQLALGRVQEQVKGMKNDIASTNSRLDVLAFEVREVKNGLVRTETAIQRTRDEMIDHVDGFIALYRNQEAEHYSLTNRTDRLEKRVDRVERHVGSA